METNKILQASFLDIIFDGRNKTYGAYELRKRYDVRLFKAIGITALLALFVALASIIDSKFSTTTSGRLHIKEDVILVELPKEEPPVEIPPVQPPPQEMPQLEMARLATPKVVDDQLVNEENEMRPNEELLDATIGTENKKGDKDLGIVAPPVEEPNTGVTVGPKEDPEDHILVHVQIEAKYPGGDQAWRKYISREINRYMDELQEEGKAGTCIVQFVVDREGNISEVEALTMKGTKLAELCVNAIRKGPKWTPAENNGKKVKAYRKQPVTFQLLNE
ncbi:MAG: energy transducer TonB [Chitinophagaceae bacterium]|nr:energy transducer TonB [Chitinophagaceae bacterium]MCW5929229.1 energy transducer TonB [Chitinophagaceae bacterium]